jgi:hypothetical protein
VSYHAGIDVVCSAVFVIKSDSPAMIMLSL